jgi:hypothetical protein
VKNDAMQGELDKAIRQHKGFEYGCLGIYALLVVICVVGLTMIGWAAIQEYYLLGTFAETTVSMAIAITITAFFVIRAWKN